MFDNRSKYGQKNWAVVDQNPYQLSVASLGTNEIGYRAACLLDDLIAGRRAAKKRRKFMVAPVGVITRESTNTIAGCPMRIVPDRTTHSNTEPMTK